MIMMNSTRFDRWLHQETQGTWKAWCILVLLLGVGGCRGPNAEEHEEEHFPPHWPNTIFEASDRLRSIVDTNGVIESKAPSIEQELLDLLEWIPELIADSDMSKADFDSVDSTVIRLAKQIEKGMGEGRSIKDLIATPGLGEAVKTLQQLCEREQARLDALGLSTPPSEGE